MKKKWLAIGLSLALAAGTVTGCGGNSQEETGNQSSDNSGTEEVTTLRIALKGISMEDERQKTWFDNYNKALQEAGIPAELEVVEMQSGTYSDNLALMLNSGAIPDIIYFQGGDQVFAAQGVLEDLTPYIEKFKIYKRRSGRFPAGKIEKLPLSFICNTGSYSGSGDPHRRAQQLRLCTDGSQ